MIPNRTECKEPLLIFLSDGKTRTLQECTDGVAKFLRLTDSERKELQSNGKETKIHFNVGWAKWSLEQEGKLETVSRGNYKITEKGIQALPEFVREKILGKERAKAAAEEFEKRRIERIVALEKERNRQISKVWTYIYIATIILSILSLLIFGEALRN